MRRVACFISLALVLSVAACARAERSFYDALKADPQHKLIMRAVDSDKQGKLKKMLQETMPITAFVPTDSAFIKAAMKFKLTKPEDSAKLMKNHCLIGAILKQHMVSGVYDTGALRSLSTKPSMLITKKMVPNTKGRVTSSWPLKFAVSSSDGDIQISSVAKTADPSDPKKALPATSGSLVSPTDVHAGGGIIHNINALLLPMTNLTRLMQVTGCHE